MAFVIVPLSMTPPAAAVGDTSTSKTSGAYGVLNCHYSHEPPGPDALINVM